ncbi:MULTISPECIES: hypothetical protein [unclassified Novosphingobium]|uniref:hypothetical protein n=1 Tax=unclassified Novosphingobium TaxID=2644732 RepID=UPI0025F52983|nr:MULTISPECIES: hypothetical protein [unclassified Novosphingobium]HQV03369.1 hypothetical protein [Novosphingobium sp.]
MNLTRDRMRSIGWVAVLLTCFTFTVILTFKVNAVKSQVRLTERQIVSIKQDKLLLETEFETRANQQQLRSLNEVEFGYQAPAAGQYLEGERQLAALGKPRAADAPSPIRVASADAPRETEGLPAMVNPLTGKAMAAEPKAEGKPKPATAATLGDRLSRSEPREARQE